MIRKNQLTIIKNVKFIDNLKNIYLKVKKQFTINQPIYCKLLVKLY